jgi:O-glycosyl hydrolase
VSVAASRGALLVATIALAAGAARIALNPPAARVSQEAAPPRSPRTWVEVNAGIEHQSIDGFGAIVRTLVMDGHDVLTPASRATALDAVYRQVGVTMGRIDPMLRESRGGFDQAQNDNADPDAIDWSGFQTAAVDAVEPKLLALPEMQGFDGYELGQMVNTRWASPWLAGLRATDYSRYVEEAAEQIVAACIHWRDRFGSIPRFLQPFNEPLSGNRELKNGSTRDLIDIVTRAGDRLTREGFTTVRFVVASEETDERSYESAAAILGDPRARSYVGAIGYHPYPYASAYANVPRLLQTSGAGRPDPDRVAARHRLRDLARKYGLPLWMTEVSNGGVDARSYDDFRARAIHIHDELTYADASAYFGMHNIWDLASHREHFGRTDTFFREEGHIALLENPTGRVYLTGIGYAIGHYARWIRRGAIRIDATTGDALVQAIAFRDDGQRQLVLVLINNADTARHVSVKLDRIGLEGEIRGEESTPSGYWTKVPPFASQTATAFGVNLPALGVVTLAGRISDSFRRDPEQRR